AGDYTVTCYLEGYEVPDGVEVTVIAGETVIVDFILEPEVDADDPLSDFSLLLLGNYPNPFNPSTTICFQLPSGCEQAEITIYNLRGQAIISYPVNSSNHQSVGSRTQPINSLIWDGKDADNQLMSSGIYYYKVRTENESATGKMIMMK
ncbi:MAG: T9SS type A sorting domain-containing protein, partial [Candidatus Cloacimonetes bacterium]|nr:T9SS type A sorting domain-containing protein [Candidatus Cloacimonadota bacterium]